MKTMFDQQGFDQNNNWSIFIDQIIDETILLELQAKAEPEQFEALASSLAELASSTIYDKMCKKYGLTRKEYDDAALFYYYSSRLTSDEKAAMKRHDVLEQAFMLNTSGRLISEMNSKILKLQMSGLEKQRPVGMTIVSHSQNRMDKRFSPCFESQHAKH